MDDLTRYSALKALNVVSLKLVGQKVILVPKRFDSATGQELPIVDEIHITPERINQLISEYQAKIVSLQALLTDVQAVK